MVQKIITFSGNVQQAGFREKLQDLARGLGITGFVENIIDAHERFPSDHAVKVFVEGKHRAVDTFIEFGTVRNSLINVDDVDISDINDDGIRFTDFYIHRDRVERELGDRLDVGVELLKKILDVQRETLVAMKSGHDRIIQNANDNTDKIIENANGNTDKVISNSNDNTDKIIENANENTDKIIINSNENTDKIIINSNENTDKIIINSNENTDKIIINSNESTDKIIINSNESTDKIIGNSNGNADRIIDHSSSGFEGLKRHISKENEKWWGPKND